VAARFGLCIYLSAYNSAPCTAAITLVIVASRLMKWSKVSSVKWIAAAVGVRPLSRIDRTPLAEDDVRSSCRRLIPKELATDDDRRPARLFIIEERVTRRSPIHLDSAAGRRRRGGADGKEFQLKATLEHGLVPSRTLGSPGRRWSGIPVNSFPLSRHQFKFAWGGPRFGREGTRESGNPARKGAGPGSGPGARTGLGV